MLAVAVALALTALCLGVLDVISSSAVLAAGNGFEVNPIHRWAQASLGQWWFMPKMLFHGVVGAMVIWYPARAVMLMVSPVLLLTAFAVWNNFSLAFAGV